MLRNIKKLGLLAILSLFAALLHSQTPDTSGLIDATPDGFVTIKAINLKGNKRTRPSYIYREMDFQVGDTLHVANMQARLEHNRLRVLNTGVFSRATVNITDWPESDSITVEFTMQESWYIWPLPIFEIADRSFNVWWVEQNRDLNRTNYGLFFIHTNFTGRRDRFRITLQGGYTHKYELDYAMPYLNRRKTLGGSVNFYYGNNREVAYMTSGNKLLFYRDTVADVLVQRRASGGITYKPKLYSLHEFRLFYFDRSTDSATILTRNPDFFLNNIVRQRFMSFLYRYTIDRRDHSTYPMSGYYINASVLKDGFGMPWENRNALTVDAHLVKFYKINERLAIAGDVWLVSNLVRQKQAYYQYKGIGYMGKIPHGYEYYVIDGMDCYMARLNVREQWFDHEYRFPYKLLPKGLRIIPIKAFLSLNADAAYVNDPYYFKQNPLNNQFLRGGGIGLDILIFHNTLLRYEFNFNQMGEHYFFLNGRFFL